MLQWSTAMFKSRQGIKHKIIDSEDSILKLWQIKTVHRLIVSLKNTLDNKTLSLWKHSEFKWWVRSYKNLYGKLQLFFFKSESFMVYLLLPWLFKILLQILKVQEFHV